jgi:plasmid stabilization system protein ParE
MAYKISYKAYAERDIWEIANYLSDYSISAAEKFLRTIKANISGLSEMPLRYPKVESNSEYRKMVVDKYVVLYIVEENPKKVLVMRIVHGMRNYKESGENAD